MLLGCSGKVIRPYPVLSFFPSFSLSDCYAIQPTSETPFEAMTGRTSTTISQLRFSAVRQMPGYLCNLIIISSETSLTRHSGQVVFGQEPGQELVIPPHQLKAFLPQSMAPWTTRRLISKFSSAVKQMSEICAQSPVSSHY